MSKRKLDDRERRRLESVISGFVGPAPVIRTFPSLRLNGVDHTWRTPEGPTGPVTLVRQAGKSDEMAVLALPRYARPLLRTNGLLLVWCPRGDLIYVDVYDVLRLPVLGADADAASLPGAAWSSVPALESVQIPARLRGDESTRFSLPAADDGEVFLISSGWGSEPDRPATAIYVWDPMTGTIDVLPQRWFTSEAHDLGYEWIARAGRDQVTGRIVGDGVRVGKFELDASGEDVVEFRGWLGWEWRAGTGPTGAKATRFVVATKF